MKVYEKGTSDHTDETCLIAIKKAKEMNTDVIVSTTSGNAAGRFCELAQKEGYTGKIVVVTHAYGSREPGTNALPEENRKRLQAAGATIITAAHVLSGAERSLSGKYNGVYPVEIIARTLYMFSQGVKVLVEIGAMALDAGVVDYGKDVVAIAGTGHGLDTAGVITPSYTAKIMDSKIRELLCKPY